MGNLVHLPWNQQCYRCGEPGHRRADCPQAGPAPAAAAADAAPVKVNPPPVPPRRPPGEISDYPREAAAVRAALGWDQTTRDQELRAIARRQVAEARSARAVFEPAPPARAELPPGDRQEPC